MRPYNLSSVRVITCCARAVEIEIGRLGPDSEEAASKRAAANARTHFCSYLC